MTKEERERVEEIGEYEQRHHHHKNQGLEDVRFLLDLVERQEETIKDLEGKIVDLDQGFE